MKSKVRFFYNILTDSKQVSENNRLQKEQE